MKKNSKKLIIIIISVLLVLCIAIASFLMFSLDRKNTYQRIPNLQTLEKLTDLIIPTSSILEDGTIEWGEYSKQIRSWQAKLRLHSATIVGYYMGYKNEIGFDAGEMVNLLDIIEIKETGTVNGIEVEYGIIDSIARTQSTVTAHFNVNNNDYLVRINYSTSELPLEEEVFQSLKAQLMPIVEDITAQA